MGLGQKWRTESRVPDLQVQTLFIRGIRIRRVGKDLPSSARFLGR